VRDEVNAKIESSGQNYFDSPEREAKLLQLCESEGINPVHFAVGFGAGFKAGAKPWAEWCERFMEALQCNNQVVMWGKRNTVMREYREFIDKKV